eukprot:3201343-Alexandrium_andersonii.AAC.1
MALERGGQPGSECGTRAGRCGHDLRLRAPARTPRPTPRDWDRPLGQQHSDKSALCRFKPLSAL